MYCQGKLGKCGCNIRMSIVVGIVWRYLGIHSQLSSLSLPPYLFHPHFPRLPSDAFLSDIGNASIDLQRTAAVSLLLGSEWIRCLIGCFASQTAVDLRTSVVKRLENLLTVENELDQIIAEQPECKDAVQEYLRDRPVIQRALTLSSASTGQETDSESPPHFIYSFRKRSGSCASRGLIHLLCP